MDNKKVKKQKRECGNCTKCCEGHLEGEALGKSFYKGSPCHFLEIGKGCTVYSQRPVNPCQAFMCEWLVNEDLPLWMKPDKTDSIVRKVEVGGIKALKIVEAGKTLRSDVLTHMIIYSMKNSINLIWEVNGGINYFGSNEFVAKMEELNKVIPSDISNI